VIGEAISVIDVTSTGRPRRGVVTRCRPDGREYGVSFADVDFADGTEGARLLARDRRWQDLEPTFGPSASVTRGEPSPATAGDDLDVSRPEQRVGSPAEGFLVKVRRRGAR